MVVTITISKNISLHFTIMNYSIVRVTNVLFTLVLLEIRRVFGHSVKKFVSVLAVKILSSSSAYL